eukprot:1570437-Prymnesium_polylepis.1
MGSGAAERVGRVRAARPAALRALRCRRVPSCHRIPMTEPAVCARPRRARARQSVPTRGLGGGS